MSAVTASSESFYSNAWGEREVRHLLNSLRRPDVAMADPLGRLLCEALGAPSPIAAVTQLIGQTFEGLGRSGLRLAELLVKSDIQATYSRAGVAAEMGLSLRQFFRYRSRAVALLTEQIKQVLGDVDAAFYPLPTLAGLVAEMSPDTAIAIYDLMEGAHDDEQLVNRMASQIDRGGEIPDAWVNECPEKWKPLCMVLQARCFELNGNSPLSRERVAAVQQRVVAGHPLKHRIDLEIHSIEVLRAKHSHDANEIHRLGGVLRRAAGDDRERLARALLTEAEGCVRLGMLAQAQQIMRNVHRVTRTNRDLRSMALLTLLSANVALMNGDLSGADELATGAFFALQEQRPDAALCQMTMGRARLALGKKWSMLPDFVMRPEGAWDRLGLEIIEARYFLRDAKFESAAQIAGRVFERCMRSGFCGLAAHAAATIAACAGLRGDDREEQRRYLQAWRLAARTRDRLAGCDVFTMPVVRPKDLGPLIVNETFCRAISAHVVERAALECNRVAIEALNRLWSTAIAMANGTSPPRGTLGAAAAEFGLTQQNIAGVGDDLALTLPHDRRERWRLRWHDTFDGQPVQRVPV